MGQRTRDDGGRFRRPPALLGRTGINLLSAMVLGGLWLLVGWQIHSSYLDALADAERDTANLTRAFGQHVSRTVSQVQQLLQEVSDRVEAGYPADLEVMRRRVAGLDRVSKFLGIMDARGLVVDATRPGAVGLDMSDSDYFRQATEPGSPRLGFGKPIIGRTPLMSSIPFWVRVEAPDGSLIAVVVGDVLSEYFAGFFSAVDLDLGAVATLMDLDGTVYARGASTPGIVGQSYPDLPDVGAAREGDGHGIIRAVSPIDGEDRIASYELLPGTRLLVSVGQDMDHVLQPYRQFRNQTLLQGTFGTLLVLALVVLVRRYVAKLEASETAARVARAEAEQATAAKSQFLAVASHELRTPLNAIIGFAEVMVHRIHGPMGNPKYAEYAEDIRSSGLHLLALINDILDLSKIEAGRMELRLEPVDLPNLATECVRLMRGRVEAAALEMRVVSAEEKAPHLRADAMKLRQVLLNLINNAVKYTPSGGSITVSVERDPLWPDDYMVMRVADTGCGMTPTEVAMAMEPFRQVNSHLTRTAEGTGLGLPVAKSLVELHGGTLSIDSVPGEGTSVSIRLPTRLHV
ncbi:ATP-binding protein [Niveispirillum sp. KHB5.9]|uniref:sensor histidine kinase n=1 Tax=Niveispirillum sp. KHB5.9 TaxID=3400269 RepID=UPI003A8840DD